jgi:hypothetical protein
MADITEEALEKITKYLTEEFPDKKVQMLVAIAIPTEKKGFAKLGMLVKGGRAFQEEILLNLAKRSGNCIEIPMNEIFPPTPKKDVN